MPSPAPGGKRDDVVFCLAGTKISIGKLPAFPSRCAAIAAKFGLLTQPSKGQRSGGETVVVSMASWKIGSVAVMDRNSFAMSVRVNR